MKKYDVLAVGEINPDLIMTGFKTMPIKGKEIFCEQMNLVLGSSTVICAAGVAKLGMSVGFVGKVAGDIFGKFCLQELDKLGIDTSRVITEDTVKTGLTISLSDEKDRALVTYLGHIETLDANQITDDMLKTARHIHVGSFFLQTALRKNLADMFRRAKALGLTVSLDAGWDDTDTWDYGLLEALKYVDIFFPNETEALNITKTATVQDAAAQLAKHCKTVCVKCGKSGAYAISEGQIVKKPTYEKIRAVDTTGAGDNFNSGFIYAFLNGMDLYKCVDFGNACGSVSVTKIGGTTGCATLAEAERVISTGQL